MIETSTLDTLKKHITVPGYSRDDSFVDSIAYYALTGRRGAWVCEDKKTKAVLCQHPNIDNRLLIFPEIGNGDGSLIADIIRSLDLSKQSVQLARFNEIEIQAVQNHLIDKPSITIHQTVEKNLDWQYPIHILDTKSVAHLNGPDFRNVRQKLRKIDEGDIQMIGLSDPDALKYLKACTKYWEGNQILYNDLYQPEDAEFYQTLFNYVQSHPTMFDGFILKYGNRISGFSIWDQTTTNTANLIANLVDINTGGLSEYQLVITCRLLNEKGISLLNRGGSEKKGLDNFKQKFSPVKSITLYSALVEKTSTPQISFIPLIQKPIIDQTPIFS